MDYQEQVKDFCRNFFKEKRSVSVKRKKQDLYMIFTEESRPYYLFMDENQVKVENFYFWKGSFRGIGYRIVYPIKTTIKKINIEKDWSTIEIVDVKKEKTLILKKNCDNDYISFYSYYYEKNNLLSHYSFLKKANDSNYYRIWKLAYALKKLFSEDRPLDLSREILTEMRRLGSYVIIHDDDV